MYAEIRNDYIYGPLVDGGIYEDEGDMLAAVTIDAWKTSNDNEEGQVIAAVILTLHGDIVVDFHDNGCRMDDGAKAAITDAKEVLRELWRKWEES